MKSLYRVNSPETSKVAARSLDTATLKEMVYNAIKAYGPNGCISDEVRDYCKKEHGLETYSSVTARYKALSEEGRIVYNGKTKSGKSGRSQRVMVAV